MDIRDWDWVVIGGMAIALLVPYMAGAYLHAKFMNKWLDSIKYPPPPKLPQFKGE